VKTGETERVPAEGLFVFIGGAPDPVGEGAMVVQFVHSYCSER
jgi:hypothetical protein